MRRTRSQKPPPPPPAPVKLWSPASRALMSDLELNWGGMTAGGRKAARAFEKSWGKSLPMDPRLRQGEPPMAREGGTYTSGYGGGRQGTLIKEGKELGYRRGTGQDPQTRQITFAGSVKDRHYDREAGKWAKVRNVESTSPSYKGQAIAGTENLGKDIRRLSRMRNEEEDLRDYLKSERSVLGKVQTVGTAQTVGGRRRATLVGKKASR